MQHSILPYHHPVASWEAIQPGLQGSSPSYFCSLPDGIPMTRHIACVHFILEQLGGPVWKGLLCGGPQTPWCLLPREIKVTPKLCPFYTICKTTFLPQTQASELCFLILWLLPLVVLIPQPCSWLATTAICSMTAAVIGFQAVNCVSDCFIGLCERVSVILGLVLIKPRAMLRCLKIVLIQKSSHLLDRRTKNGEGNQFVPRTCYPSNS